MGIVDRVKFLGLFALNMVYHFTQVCPKQSMVERLSSLNMIYTHKPQKGFTGLQKHFRCFPKPEIKGRQATNRKASFMIKTMCSVFYKQISTNRPIKFKGC